MVRDKWVFDIITKKNNKTKKSSVKIEQIEKVVKPIPKKLPENEKMTDNMKYFILNQFYEEEEEEEGESCNEEKETEENIQKDEDIIGFN